MSILTQVLEIVRAAHGPESVLLMDQDFVFDIPHTSTGIPQLDLALGIGGIPHGRIIEIYGPESAGKTTMLLKFMAQMQKNDKVCALIDVENSFDPAWATKIGVDVGKLLVSQPTTGEEALQISDTMIQSEGVSFIGVDSVAALVPRAELEGTMGQAHIGLQARLMSQAMRKLTGVLRKSGCILAFTNQIREKVGIIWGSNETTPGGRALKFYASIRLDVRRGKQIKEKDEVLGNSVTIKVVKNKVAPPFKMCECELLFDSGFDTEANMFECALAMGIVSKRGAWYSLGEENLGSGKKNSIVALKSSEELVKKLNEAIEAHYLPRKKEVDDKEEFRIKLVKYEKKLAEAIANDDKEAEKKYKKNLRIVKKKLGVSND